MTTRTAAVDVGGLLSPLIVRGVEKRLLAVRGVKRADVSYVSGSATVEYDEAVTSLETIKAR